MLLVIFSTLPLNQLPKPFREPHLHLSVSASQSHFLVMLDHRFHQRHHFQHLSVYHPLSLSLQTQNLPFPQITPFTVFSHRLHLDGLQSYPALALVLSFRFFSVIFSVSFPCLLLYSVISSKFFINIYFSALVYFLV